MNNDADAPDPASYVADSMREQVAKWVRDAVAASGKSAAEIGRRLGAYGMALNRNAMSELQKGERQLAAVEMLAMAEITGQPLPCVTPNPAQERLSPAFLREFLGTLAREAGLSDAEADRFVATALTIARRLEGRQGSDDYAQTLRLQAEALALILFPERPPKQ